MSNEFNYEEEDGEIIITRYTGSGGDVVIPAEIDGQPVTTIDAGAFKDCKSLTSVTIPEGVTMIGCSAFSGCASLTQITVSEKNSSFQGQNGMLLSKDGKTLLAWPSARGDVLIPDDVTTVGFSVFEDCEFLTSVAIPEGVTEIGDGAFSGCTALTQITVSSENPSFQGQNGVLLSKDGKTLLAWPSARGDVVIPNGVTRIGDGALEGCTSLTSVVIPESVMEIESSAFWGCTSLTQITVSERNSSFQGQNGMLLSKDGKKLIEWPSARGDVVIPDGVTEIVELAFCGCTSLTSVVIPDGVTEIAEGVFYGCTSLTSVVIPDGVTMIGKGAFGGCKSLTSVVIPSSMTEIGDGAFFDCKSLTSVVISKGVTEIGGLAFSGCESLTSVVIPDGVTEIGFFAFWGCESLTISAPAGSVAQRYAEENNIPFTDIK